MIYKDLVTIEDFIFDALKIGPQNIVELIESIKKKRQKTTKQGVYAAIRSLKKDNKVIVYGGKVALNSSWLKDMTDYFSIASYHYTHRENQKNDFVNLQDGEKMQYNFKNPISTDTFWGHAQNLLVETAAPNTIVISYDPHYWPLLIRPIEKELINFVLNKKLKFFLVAGGKTEMDKVIKKEFNDSTSQYCAIDEVLFKKRNYYVSVIGDFIIEVWIDKKVALEIDRIYEQNIVSDELKAQIEKIVSGEGNTRFQISRNKRKADTLRRKMMKYFVIMNDKQQKTAN